MPQLTHYIISAVIHSKLATLWDINNKYDIWDVLQLYEIVAYDNINKCITINERG